MTKKAHTPRKLRRRLGLFAALAALAALMAVPATGSAAAPVKFGAQLNPTVQPSNGSPGVSCGYAMPGALCTMVQEEAYGRPDGGHLAPKTGTIKRIRIIAADAGSFRPQIVNVRHSASTTLGDTKAKVTYTGPRLSYAGQTEANEESGRYRVESFPVNIPVKKGQQLALRGDIASMVRCSSGGHNTLIFSPALRAGGAFQGATDSSGCWILMEAVIR